MIRQPTLRPTTRRPSLRRPPARRVGAIAAAATVVSLSVWAGPAVAVPAAAGASAKVGPVFLNGAGSWDVANEMLPWGNALFGRDGALNVNYTAEGGALGQQAYVSKSADFVISGVGFTGSQLHALGGAKNVIAAPVMPSAVGFMFQPPVGDFDVLGPSGQQIQHYVGPYNIPLANITAMMLDDASFDPRSGNLDDFYVEWDDPPITKTWPGLKLGKKDFLSTGQPLAEGPEVYGRSDPNETSYYAQLMMATAERKLWVANLVAAGDKHPPTPATITQTYPTVIPLQTKEGVQLQVQALLANVGNQNFNGSVADVPPMAMEQVKKFNQAQKAQHLRQIEVKWLGVPNAEGQYVDPTPRAIDASIKAGGATPLYGLTHKVAGGYPLTYVDDLYAPAHGLGIAQMEALATVIRYLATGGQKITAQLGDAQLSPALVKQALTAADRLITSNCTASDEHVVTSTDPGPYGAGVPGLGSIGEMDNCLPGAPPAPTTTTTTTTTLPSTTPGGTGGGGGGGFGGGGGGLGGGGGGGTGSPGTGSGATTPPPAPTGTTTPPTTAAPSSPSSASGSTSTTTAPAKAASPAPTTPPSTAPAVAHPRSALSSAVRGTDDLEAPTSDQGSFDHLAALLLGAGLLLLVRRPARRLLRLLRP